MVSERDLLRDAGLDLGLARGDLALAGLEDLAHDDVLDLLGLDVGALERGLDRDAAQLGGVEGRQPAAQLADRRSGGAEDDGLGHVRLPVVTSGAEDIAVRRTAYARRLTRRCASPPPPNARDTGADTVVVGVFDGEDVAHDVQDGGAAGAARRPARPSPASASSPSPTPTGKRWMLVGLGERDELRRRARARRRRDGARPRAGARHARRCAGRSRTTSTTRSSAALVEGTRAGRLPLRRVQVDGRRRHRATTGSASCSSPRTTTSRAPVARAAIVAEAVNARARPAEHAGEPHDADARSRERAEQLAGSRRGSSVEVEGARADRGARHGRVRRGRAGLATRSRRSSCCATRAPTRHGAGARPRRQGGDVRHRRHLDQARREDARDEVRHVRRRRRARGDRARSRALELPVDVVGRRRRDREHAERPRDQARRRRHAR